VSFQESFNSSILIYIFSFQKILPEDILFFTIYIRVFIYLLVEWKRNTLLISVFEIHSRKILICKHIHYMLK